LNGFIYLLSADPSLYGIGVGLLTRFIREFWRSSCLEDALSAATHPTERFDLGVKLCTDNIQFHD
jgi:hypothetical protein